MTISTAEPAIASTASALRNLKVTGEELSSTARGQLDDQGFVVLPGIVDGEWLDELRRRTDELLTIEGANAGHELGEHTSATTLGDLLNKGQVFERMLRVPVVLAAMAHVLGEYRVNSLNYRSAQPGQGNQALHSDCGNLTDDGRYKLCNSIWLLDEFTEHNGATRYLAGSHSSGRLPGDVFEDPSAPQPEQRLMTAPAGSVVVFNGHLWHGGTDNLTNTARRGLTLSFVQRDHPQQTDQAEHIRKAVYDRLSPAERFLLDV